MTHSLLARSPIQKSFCPTNLKFPTVIPVNTGMTVIGAFGPGLYNTTMEGAVDDSGTAVGLMATGSFRYAITDSLFVGGALHYKNAAVEIEEFTVNGGFLALFINVGFFF